MKGKTTDIKKKFKSEKELLGDTVNPEYTTIKSTENHKNFFKLFLPSLGMPHVE